MKKLIIAYVIFMFIVFSVIALLAYQIQEGINDVKTKVGEKVIINQDTLMIIDYSVLNSNYKLDNGTVISFGLSDKLMIKTK